MLLLILFPGLLSNILFRLTSKETVRATDPTDNRCVSLTKGQQHGNVSMWWRLHEHLKMAADSLQHAAPDQV